MKPSYRQKLPNLASVRLEAACEGKKHAENAAAKTERMKRLALSLGRLLDELPHELEDPHDDKTRTDDGHDFYKCKPRK